MRLALVFDAPRPGGRRSFGVADAYLDKTLEACAAVAGVTLETETFYAVADAQPGGKAPSVALVRKERDRLRRELQPWAPDAILSFGAAAMNGLDRGAKALVISKERGRMRLWQGAVPWVPTISSFLPVKHADLHRDLANDAYKVMSQPWPLPPMEIDFLVPTTPQDLTYALSNLDGASAIGVDVETTGLRPARDALLAVGFGATYDDGTGLAVIVTKEMLDRGVEDVLWDATWRQSRRSVGHNFKFDMQFLAPLLGFPPEGASLGDTLLMAHLLDERPNRPTSRVRGLGLKDLVAVRYDHQYGFDFGEFYQSEDPDYDAMHEYLAQDVCYTARLWHDLSSEAAEESERLPRVHDDLLMPVSVAIAKAELGGAPVNVAWIRETVAIYTRRIERRQAVLERALARLTSRQVSNILAPQQVADVMYDDWRMTPDVRKHGVLTLGDRSTDKDHVKAAVAKYLGTKLDREARWLRSLEKLRRDIRQRTTYQKSLLDKVDPDDRVRASFLLHGTVTGRLSSQGPNLQNVPAIDREDAIKFRPMREAFAPSGDKYWVEVDYSQLELRVAAALSGDQDLAEVFRSGRDVHREIATGIFSKPADEISKAERFLAKAVSFGIIYGRGGLALSSGAEMRYAEQKLGMKPWTEDQANAFIKKFLRSYPALDAWMQKLYREVPRAGYVESPFGRRRRFPLSPKSKGELGSIQRQAVNTPVQSAASDICLQAMVALTDFIEAHDLDSRVLFTVHDSICLEVPDYEIGGMEGVCREIMEKDFMGVPLRVDFEYGPDWAHVR